MYALWPVWVHVNLGNACVCIEVYISISRKGVTIALLYSILNQFFRAHRPSLYFLKVMNMMPRKSAIASHWMHLSLCYSPPFISSFSSINSRIFIIYNLCLSSFNFLYFKNIIPYLFAICLSHVVIFIIDWKKIYVKLYIYIYIRICILFYINNNI